jgi:hypothetical protein
MANGAIAYAIHASVTSIQQRCDRLQYTKTDLETIPKTHGCLAPLRVRPARAARLGEHTPVRSPGITQPAQTALSIGCLVSM